MSFRSDKQGQQVAYPPTFSELMIKSEKFKITLVL